MARSPQVEVWPVERVYGLRRGIDERFAVIIPIGSGLGLRQGEILGLSPDDIDWDRLVVHVQRQLKTVAGVKMFALPKRGKSPTVPVPSSVLAEIDEHLDAYPSVRRALPWARPDGVSSSHDRARQAIDTVFAEAGS